MLKVIFGDFRVVVFWTFVKISRYIVHNAINSAVQLELNKVLTMMEGDRKFVRRLKKLELADLIYKKAAKLRLRRL